MRVPWRKLRTRGLGLHGAEEVSGLPQKWRGCFYEGRCQHRQRSSPVCEAGEEGRNKEKEGMEDDCGDIRNDGTNDENIKNKRGK
jgi:hypothetical protein